MLRNKNKALAIFCVCGVVILIAVLLSSAKFKFLRSNKFSQPQATPTAETSDFKMMRFPETLIWTAFNDGRYFNAPFSFEVPYTGPYCDCVDGTGGLQDSSLRQVEGGFFDGVWQGQADAKWLLLSGVYGPHDLLEQLHGWAVPSRDFYTYLSAHPVGEEFAIPDEDGKPQKTIRLPDSYIQGVRVLKFQTDQNAMGFGEKSRKFAIYKRKNLVFFLSFEYNQHNKLYEGVFDHMIATLRFSPRSQIVYDKNIEKYFDSYTSTLPTQTFEFPNKEGSMAFPKDWRVITPIYSSSSGRLVELRDNLTDWEALEVSRISTTPTISTLTGLRAYVDASVKNQKITNNEKVSVIETIVGGQRGYKVSVAYQPDAYFILVGDVIYRFLLKGAQGLDQVARFVVNTVRFGK